jgi:putative phosphoesterase
MRLAVVSDTHLPRFGMALPRELLAGFARERVQRILHAGDWTTPLAVDLLEAVAPVDGVAGNNDGPELHERFGTRRVLDVDGVRIAITHGHLGTGRTTEERATNVFAGDEGLAAIVFGHSHVPVIRRPATGPWLINPGSPTDKRRQPAFTWALVTIDHGALAGAEIISFDDRAP